MHSILAVANLLAHNNIANSNWYYCLLRSYKKGCFFFLLFYVFFDVESESEVSFVRSPYFLSYKNNVLDRHEIEVIN